MTAPHTYITTIPYVNARPHIGFALELVQADVLARAGRGRGDVALGQSLSLTVDNVIRTSRDPRHRPGVERFWRACAEAGDLYRQRYEGLYCTGCEQFYQPAELRGGRCPEHDTVPQPVTEENWFFRLSRYAGPLHRRAADRPGRRRAGQRSGEPGQPGGGDDPPLPRRPGPGPARYPPRAGGRRGPGHGLPSGQGPGRRRA